MKNVINGLVAFGTLTLAAVAIWGDYLRAKWAPPKLRIVPFNTRGTATRFTEGAKVIYYHMKVVNDRPWFAAKNCQVRLTDIALRGTDNQFTSIPNPVPQTFVWSPAHMVPAAIDIAREQIFDFGQVAEGATQFVPVLYWYPNNFRGVVMASQALQFTLEIVANNILKRPRHIFQVAWNGQWSDNLDNMALNLTIREIPPAQ